MSSVRSLYQPQSQEYFFKLYSFNFFVQVHDPLWIKKISPLLLGRGQKWQPTPIFLPGGFHEQRSRVGYSWWVCKDLDVTEQLTLFPENTSAMTWRPCWDLRPMPWRRCFSSSKSAPVSLIVSRPTSESVSTLAQLEKSSFCYGKRCLLSERVVGPGWKEWTKARERMGMELEGDGRRDRLQGEKWRAEENVEHPSGIHNWV